MRIFRSWDCLYVTVLTSSACWFVASSAAQASVLAPGSSVGGKTIAEWTGDWWNWAIMEPTAINPVADTTGEFAGVNQPGRPVFFIGGTFGGDAVRSFEVPVGTHLLIPMVNVVAWVPESGPDETSVTALANEAMNDATQLHFSLDGQPLANPFGYREQSPPFVLSMPAGSLYVDCCGLTPGDREPAVSDGYWVMLEPLSPGQHLLEFGGTIGGDGPMAGFSTGVTANLNVVPPGRRLGFVPGAVPEPTSALLFAMATIGLTGILRYVRRATQLTRTMT